MVTAVKKNGIKSTKAPKSTPSKYSTYSYADFTEMVLTALEKAGRAGLLTGEIQAKFNVSSSWYAGWWHHKGNKDARIHKAGKGHIVLAANVEAGKAQNLPVVPTHVKKAVTPQTRGVVHWTSARQIPYPPGQQGPNGEKFYSEPGHYERLALKVADMLWEHPLDFTVLTAVQRIMNDDKLREDIPFRNITSQQQISKLVPLVHSQLMDIRKMFEDLHMEPVVVTEQIKQTPEEALAALSTAQVVEMLVERLGKEFGQFVTFVESMRNFTAQMLPAGSQIRSSVLEQIKPKAQVRKPSIAVLASVSPEQYLRLSERVKDVLDLDRIDTRQGTKIVYRSAWAAFFADQNPTSLSFFRNTGKNFMEKAHKPYVGKQGWHAVEEAILDYAQQLRREAGLL